MDGPSYCRSCRRTYSATAGERCPDGCDQALISPAVHKQHRNKDLLGDILGGRFALVEPIGHGGFADVYRGVQLPEGIQCAVKVINCRVTGVTPDEAKARFVREARLMANLTEPTTLRLIAFGNDDDLLYLVAEFIEGDDLRSLLRDGPLSVERAVNLVQQILESLAEAHEARVVHRDITPDNVLVRTSRGGRELVKVIDFGIAKDVEDSATLTRRGVGFGKATYAPIEQFDNLSIPSQPSHDTFAVGVVLFELLTGRLPYADTGDDIATLRQQRALPLPERPEEIPQPLFDVISKALAKQIDDRFTDATQMASALSEAMEHLALPQTRLLAPIDAAPLDLISIDPGRALGRRSRVPLWIASALVLLAVGALLSRVLWPPEPIMVIHGGHTSAAAQAAAATLASRAPTRAAPSTPTRTAPLAPTRTAPSTPIGAARPQPTSRAPGSKAISAPAPAVARTRAPQTLDMGPDAGTPRHEDAGLPKAPTTRTRPARRPSRNKIKRARPRTSRSAAPGTSWLP